MSQHTTPQKGDTAASSARPYVADGMPPLETKRNTVSAFEFWPTWLIYLPVVMQWLVLSLRYRSLTLPLIANPELPLSGMVGVPKSHVLSQSKSSCANRVLPWFTYVITDDEPASQQLALVKILHEKGFQLPLVCKPDIGCRGAGVKLVETEGELKECLRSYPVGSTVMIQKLANFEPEAGVFYVRDPRHPKGKIISLALKYTPYVVGDGVSTLRQLIASDERAGRLMHLYTSRNAKHLERVLDEGEAFKLLFSASHCRGAIFRDACHLITPELTEHLNTILADIPNFHYGRLDIKFSCVEKLQRGEDIEIVEINTASSESLHIWDSDTRLGAAVKALMFQYHTLFQLGHQNRKLGYKTPGIRKLLQHWRLERELTAQYPETD